jgi:hypothetical protein
MNRQKIRKDTRYVCQMWSRLMCTPLLRNLPHTSYMLNQLSGTDTYIL